MTTFLLIARLIIVLGVFAMFLRRPTVTWGIGLLTVTTAVLLDAYLVIVGRAEALAALGFFASVLEGSLLAGAAVWIWGLLRPLTASTAGGSSRSAGTEESVAMEAPHAKTARLRTQPGTVYDRQQMYEQIRFQLGPEDVLDLIFDLGLNENDVVGLSRDMNQIIVRLMDMAEAKDLTSELALAVERILVPLPLEGLPRRDRLSAESPPTILRQYLLAHFDMAGLDETARALDLDPEQLGLGNKKARARSLLLHLYRRNQIDGLIALLQPTDAARLEEE